MAAQAGKYARFELERRFLVGSPPDGLERGRSWRILDRYVEGTRLRLRRMESADGGEVVLKLGQKETLVPPDYGRMTITTLYLSPAEYDVLAALPALELRKRRHEVRHAGRSFGLDVFEGALTGLVLAETGFETDEEMDGPLDLPSWVAADVTGDLRYTGGELVRLSAAEAVALVRRSAPPRA